jgi:predicted homoserine dehydrogenase-like protein
VILIDTALQARAAAGKPIRVGLLGAGFMARGLTNTIVNSVPGMRIVAICNRRIERAAQAYTYAGVPGALSVNSQDDLEDAIRSGKPAAMDDPFLLSRSEQIDVIVDTTGSVEYSARVLLDAFAHGKDVVLMNAEIDATIGPILQVHAAKHGVILSACDGDEPGVQVNLYRWAKGLGLTPRVMGNVKGLLDPYRNPATQMDFAEKWGQTLATVTAAVDGSKISFEQAIVANATGFVVRTRGMSRGAEYRDSVMKIADLYDIDELRRLGGIVDYVVGTPLTKVYCLAELSDQKQQHYLKLYKMGDGPLYTLFAPQQFVHLEVPTTIARAVLFRDSVAKPLGGPVVEVCAVAKRDLSPGETLDDFGMYMTYGEAVNTGEMSSERYLPEGLVEGCRLRVAVKKDSVLTYDDIVVPPNRFADQLRAEQYTRFRGETWLQELLDGGSQQSLRRAETIAVQADP